jgi:hypothetical protein
MADLFERADALDVMAPRRRTRLIAPEPVRDNPYEEPWTFLERVIANTGAVQPCEEVARVVVDLLSADEPPLRVQSSPPSRLAAGPRAHHASHSAVISGP